MTGLECPFCGMQRAIIALMQGNIAEAFAFNPVVWCMSPYFAIVLLSSLSTRIHDSLIGRWAMRSQTVLSALGILAAWGIIRNII